MSPNKQPSPGHTDRHIEDKRLQLLDRVAANPRMPGILRSFARIEAGPRRVVDEHISRIEARTAERRANSAEQARVANEGDAAILADAARRVREHRESLEAVQTSSETSETPPAPNAEK